MPRATKNGPYIFISYASADRDRVLPLVDRLERAGITTWIDRDGISGGASYALEIAEAIKGSTVMMLMCSGAALASRNVKQEIALSWRFERPYLPLLLEPVTVPDDMAYWLEAAQWVEILDHPENVWMTQVTEALQRHGVTTESGPLPQSARTTPRERPLLVGREQEREILSKHLDRTLAGNGTTVLVGGEAGIGKTTLVEDLSVEAVERGARVLWGHAYDLASTPPYGPWVEILRQYHRLGDDWPPVPAFVNDSQTMAGVGSQDSLFATVRDYLCELAEHRPLVLVLDDLHWADQASLDFLRYFSRQIAPHRVLLVATYRTDELHRRHPLYAYLPLFVREANASRVAIRPLTTDGLRELIRSQFKLSSVDQQRLEQYLTEHAEGNPLYAEELLRTLEGEGVLVRSGQIWTLDDLDQVRLPPMLLQVIEGRLRRLGEPTRQLLQIAAVIGQDVPLRLWQRAADTEDEALAGAVEQGIAAHLLVETSSGTVRFNHALFREALYSSIVVVRRRSLHRRIAELGEETHDPDPNQLAYHYEQAGDQRAVTWWIHAAKRARRTYAWQAAGERLEAAARVQEQLGVRIVPQQALFLQSAITPRFSVDPETAIIRLNAAISEAEKVGDPVVEAVGLAELGHVRGYLGQFRQGTAEIERALSMCDRLDRESPGVFDREDARLRILGWNLLQRRLAACRTVVMFYWALVGRLAEALDAGEPLREALLNVNVDSRFSQTVTIDSGTSISSEYHIGNAAYGLGVGYSLLGRVDDAERFFDLACNRYQSQGISVIVSLEVSVELFVLTLPLQSERINRRRYLQQVIRDATSQVHDLGPLMQSQIVPDFAVPMIEGDWDAARDRVGAVRAMLSIRFSRAMAGAILAAMERHQGQTTAATALVSDVFPDGVWTEPGDCEFVSAQMLQRIAAHIALDQGDLETARAWLEAHDRWLEWSGAVLGRADGDLVWAHYHRQNGDDAIARERAEQALRRASDPRQAFALIAIHRFLGELDTDERQYDEAEQHLQESLSLADACLAPFERALTLLSTAELRAAQQKPDDARALLTEVRSICEPLKAKPTLERVAALETRLNDASSAKPETYPAGLTAREVEVLRLIAQGMTDAQAAEQLFLSPRTVGTHLSSIYGKLNVSSRTGATRFAVENGLV